MGVVEIKIITMLEFANKYGGNITSQFGENFIIDEIIKRIGLKPGVAIEFGAPTKEYCSNIFPLIEKGWDCKYYDIDPKESGIIKMEMTTSNINTLPACDVLSMDTDGPDYELWLAYRGHPDIVIIEINSSLPPMRQHYTRATGASYVSMLRLGIDKGYFLVCHTGNMIFVLNKHRSLFPEIKVEGLFNWEDYFNTSHLPKC